MRVKKSKYCVNESAVLVSDYMSGKMENIPSISTSCLVNPRCLKRMANGCSICHECFAADGLSYKKGLRENYVQNYEILNSKILSLDELPVFKDSVEIVRIESFGDVGSETQCYNYINLCNLNPHVQFAMWTKNPDLWEAAINDLGKPENLICILSSERINIITDVYKKYKWFDHVFTVYDDDYINANNIDINCGARSCDTCRRCYIKDNKDFFVNEKLK